MLDHLRLDVDECSDGEGDCDDSATCKNIPGGYDCKCNSGYVGNGIDCTGESRIYIRCHIFNSAKISSNCT